MSAGDRRDRSGGRHEGRGGDRRGAAQVDPGKQTLTSGLRGSGAPASSVGELARITGGLPYAAACADDLERIIGSGDFAKAILTRDFLVDWRQRLASSVRDGQEHAASNPAHASKVAEHRALAEPLLARCDALIDRVPELSPEDRSAVMLSLPLTDEGAAVRETWCAAHGGGGQLSGDGAPAAPSNGPASAGQDADPAPLGEAAGQAADLPWERAAAPTAVPFQPEMESVFGEDFSDVSAYVGAGDLGASDARAATAGNSIGFRSESPDRSLVAHELTHVVQSRHAGGSAVAFSRVGPSVDDPAEREADEVAHIVADGSAARVTVSQTPTAAVHFDRGAGEATATSAHGGPASHRTMRVVAYYGKKSRKTWVGATDVAGPATYTWIRKGKGWDYGGGPNDIKIWKLDKKHKPVKSEPVARWAKGASMVIIEIGASEQELLDREQAGKSTDRDEDATAEQDAGGGSGARRSRTAEGVGSGTDERRSYGEDEDASGSTTTAADAEGGGGQGAEGEASEDLHAGRGKERDARGKNPETERVPEQGSDGIIEGGGTKDQGGTTKSNKWVDNPNAERGYDGKGDPIPEDGGRSGGLAGGEQGSKDHGAPGATGWWAIIDDPAGLGAAIGVLGVLSDADIAGSLDGLMKKAGKVLGKRTGKGARKLAKELERDIAKEVDELTEKGMKKARAELEKIPDWKYLDDNVKASKLRQARESVRDHVQRRMAYHLDKIAKESRDHAKTAEEAAALATGDEKAHWIEMAETLRHEADEAVEVAARLRKQQKAEAAARGSGSYQKTDDLAGGATKAEADAAEQFRKTREYWTQEEVVGGMKVYQRDDIIDPARLDKHGRTSLERMRKGEPPIGPDGAPVELHHLNQADEGPVVEVTKTFHTQNKAAIHINGNKMGSGIDRDAFKAWRKSYWEHRAQSFGG